MPELPEMEAWRRALDAPVSAFAIEKAGPAHIATLKTFDPPLSSLAGEGFKGVERRAKRFLLPTDDDELVLMVHLMSAGRLKYVEPGGKGDLGELGAGRELAREDHAFELDLDQARQGAGLQQRDRGV